MSRITLTGFALLLLLFLGNSSENYAAQSKPNTSDAPTGTFQKMIVENGSVTMNLDLNRFARSTSAGSVQGLSGRGARDIAGAVARLLEHSRAERIVTCSPADYLAFTAYSGRETRFITECLR